MNPTYKIALNIGIQHIRILTTSNGNLIHRNESLLSARPSCQYELKYLEGRRYLIEQRTKREVCPISHRKGDRMIKDSECRIDGGTHFETYRECHAVEKMLLLLGNCGAKCTITALLLTNFLTWEELNRGTTSLKWDCDFESIGSWNDTNNELIQWNSVPLLLAKKKTGVRIYLLQMLMGRFQLPGAV